MKVCVHIPDVLYFSHDENDTEGDPWALFSYFGNCKEELDIDNDNDNTNEEINIDINIRRNNSNLKWDMKTSAEVKTTPLSSFSLQQHNNSSHSLREECKHYPTTMTKIRYEFGFDEPHPRHGRVPVDECLDYAQMILRDVVLPIQFSFFEWSSSSSSSSSSLLSSSIQFSGHGADWKLNLRAVAVDWQTDTPKPFDYHDMVAVYRLALQRLSAARQDAGVDDERMDTLLKMMYTCVASLEHEWDEYDGRCPPPLPAALCHMDLQPQNLTFWHDRHGDDANHKVVDVHVSNDCSVASLVDFEEAVYADPRFEVLLICRKVLSNIEQADELWKSYASSVKLQTTWEVGPMEPWLRLETVHSLFTLLLQAND
jgi:hypothetical protein